MNSETFDRIIRDHLDKCRKTLLSKNHEYATDVDRLHNFKRAAELQRTTPIKSLQGFMTKHIISVYDMIESGDSYSRAQWDEKIGDTINYLLLLLTLVEDANIQRIEKENHA